jgi:hypothetical protein
MNTSRPEAGRSRGHRLPGSSTTVLGSAMLACLMLALLAGPAQAKDGQVTVRAAGITNASVTVKLSDLGSNDINNRVYRLRSGPVTISGHSLLKVMNAADEASDQIDLATVPAIEIDRPGGGSRPIRVSGDDVRNPAAFADGPPVFYEDNGATVFVMPGSGEATGNRFRFVGAPVGISVSSGASYGVNLSASRTKIKRGGKVTFTASVTGHQSGEVLSFRWRFGDGTVRTTSGGKVSHGFQRSGAFPVIVDVSGSSGAGQSGILIEVGEADRLEPKPKPKPEPKPKPDDAGNPDPWNPQGTGGTGGYGGGAGGFGSGFGNGAGSFGTGAGGSIPALPSLPAPSAPKDPEPKATPAVDDGLVEVTGELVDPQTGATVSPAETDSVESANPAPPGNEQGGFGIPGAAWTLAGVGLLMGLGVFGELRIFSRLY